MKPMCLLAVATLSVVPAANAATCPDVLNHRFKTVMGKEVNLCDYADRPVLVVNTASRCGYTPQFSKLQAMYDQYKDQGLVVLGFPSNDFRQELATNQEVGEFCQVNYGVKFPMMEMSSVKGSGANAFFKGLAGSSGVEPGWNFHKYLIAPGGKEVYSFATRVEPDAGDVMSKLKPMLK
jgi:glutathione peroxidase